MCRSKNPLILFIYLLCFLHWNASTTTTTTGGHGKKLKKVVWKMEREEQWGKNFRGKSVCFVAFIVVFSIMGKWVSEYLCVFATEREWERKCICTSCCHHLVAKRVCCLLLFECQSVSTFLGEALLSKDRLLTPLYAPFFIYFSLSLLMHYPIWFWHLKRIESKMSPFGKRFFANKKLKRFQNGKWPS